MIFSIIIPYYNKCTTIQSCIESVLLQSYSSFEIIIVDDFSDTHNYNYLNDFLNDINGNIKIPITLLKNIKNEGPSYSRNRGIEYSKGDVLIFLDADDKITKNYLNSLFEIFNNNIDCSIIISSSTESKDNICRPNYKKLYEKGFLKKIDSFLYTTNDFVATFTEDPIFCGGGNIAIRNNCVKSIRYSLLERNFEDWLFFYQLCSENTNGILMMDNKEGILYNNQISNSLSRKTLLLSEVKYPIFLQNADIDYRFRKYVYFNWYYSILKRSNIFHQRIYISIKYFRINYFNPLPIWKFFLPSLLLIFKLDYFVNIIANFRKNLKYGK